MNRIDLIDKLLKMPARILVEEERLLEAQAATQNAQYTLEEREGYLLQTDAIDGKNAEIRKAQLQEHTKDERIELMKAVHAEAHARTNLVRAQNEFAALRAVSRLMAGEVA